MQIGDSAERLKRVIDDHRKRLLSELGVISDGRRRDTESVEADVTRHLSALETFCRYSDELCDRGSPCDVAEAADKIRRRAETLTLFDVSEHVADHFRPINVSFAASQTPSAGSNVVGCVSVIKDADRGMSA